MEKTGKSTDCDVKDKHGNLMNCKDIKSKLDLNDLIGVTFQGQDYSNGLNAEVDLDESVEKKDDQINKSKEVTESEAKEGGVELVNGDSEKASAKVNPENRSPGQKKRRKKKKKKKKDSSKERSDSVDSRERSDLVDSKGRSDSVQSKDRSDSVESKDRSDSIESKEPSDSIDNTDNSEGEFGKVTDNLVVRDTENSDTKEDMGNNLEGKDKRETNVDDGLQTKNETSIKAEDATLDNNNLKTAEDNEKSNLVQKSGDLEVNEEVSNSGQVLEKNIEIDTVTGIANLDIEEDKNAKKEIEVTACEGTYEKQTEDESTEGLEIKKESVTGEHSNDSILNDTDNAKDKPLESETGKEIADDEEFIDHEKIKNFIDEVINDIQGIVIEADACDSVVDKLCDEKGENSESIKVDNVDNVSEVGVNPYILAISGEDNKGMDISSTKEEPCVNQSENIVDSSTNDKNKLDENKLTCELVIKEETDFIDNSKHSVCQNEESEKREVADHKENTNVELGITNTGDKADTQDLQVVTKEITEVSNTQGIDIETQTDKQEDNKAKNDIKMLEEELKMAQTALKKSQRCLQDERSEHNRDVISLKLQLYKSQAELKQQKSKSEKQLTEIMSHLIMLESRLRREQLKLQRETRAKDAELNDQKREIVKLKNQNDQLMNAIKEICANGGMNGYMRRKNSESSETSAKGNRDKKGHAGKLSSMKDKFSTKNRSSLELNSLNLEKYLIKNERLYSSQDDLRRLGDERRKSVPSGDERVARNQLQDSSPRPVSDNSEYKNGNHTKHVRYANQNFFSEYGSPKYEMNKSVSDSSHLSESSGFHSLSDHDLSAQNDSLSNGNHDYIDDDDDDDRIFSFSSTHINTVIDEEEAMGPGMSHSGQMMSMGSMPMLAHCKDELGSGKNRPHSLSSVDLMSIQQQAQNLSRLEHRGSPKGSPVSVGAEVCTPPSSPSYVHSKNEMTPFQTFKTMFRRKGSSKSKGHKKRSVSLSQTTNMEYSEALKKHFQKYDMS